ncbi:MAG: hypothetical protein ACJ8F3_14885 [Xanthobacteraceae bacterium]
MTDQEKKREDDVTIAVQAGIAHALEKQYQKVVSEPPPSVISALLARFEAAAFLAAFKERAERLRQRLSSK